jgi:uroporphyrinogen decarboxylase
MTAALSRHTDAFFVTMQGNLDPCALYATTEIIQAETRAMLEGFGPQTALIGKVADSPAQVIIPGYTIAGNLGHGMMPSHTPEGLGKAR